MAFICENCGKVFKSEYYEDGYINHTNFTNNFNGKIVIKDRDRAYRYFLSIINLDGNLCNKRKVSYGASKGILDCAIKTMTNVGNIEMIEMFKSFSIEKAFDDVSEEIIKQYEYDIEEIKDNIEYTKRHQFKNIKR